jgi:hypothetical protein
MLKPVTVAAALAVLAISACSVAPIFTKPQPSAGKLVTVTGHLKFGFANRNLFPSGAWQGHRTRGECIPVGVRSEDAALLARAAQLDGQKVTVTGKVERLVEADEINASFCKDVGIVAVKIDAC